MVTRRWAALLALVLAAAAQASEPSKSETKDEHASGGPACHWSYDASTHDGTWGASDWSHCSAACSGALQSPIDITGEVPGSEGPVSIEWDGTETFAVSNNGHAIVATPTPVHSGTVHWLGGNYTLAQFHFHVPSEHTVRGVRHAAEVHFVTTGPDGGLLVFGVFLDPGATLPGDDSFRQLMAAAEGGSVTLASLGSLLPPSKSPKTIESFYTYQGSLTTPPCSENVRFVILKNPRTLAAPTMDQIVSTNRSLLHGANARPIQNRGDRVVEAIP